MVAISVTTTHAVIVVIVARVGLVDALAAAVVATRPIAFAAGVVDTAVAPALVAAAAAAATAKPNT